MISLPAYVLKIAFQSVSVSTPYLEGHRELIGKTRISTSYFEKDSEFQHTVPDLGVEIRTARCRYIRVVGRLTKQDAGSSQDSRNQV